MLNSNHEEEVDERWVIIYNRQEKIGWDSTCSTRYGNREKVGQYEQHETFSWKCTCVRKADWTASRRRISAHGARHTRQADRIERIENPTAFTCQKPQRLRGFMDAICFPPIGCYTLACTVLDPILETPLDTELLVAPCSCGYCIAATSASKPGCNFSSGDRNQNALFWCRGYILTVRDRRYAPDRIFF